MSLDDHVSPDPSDLDTTDGPLGPLPRLVSRQVRLEERLARLSQVDGLGGALAWLSVPLGADVTIGAPEIRWKTTGLTRAGVVFQLGWPRLATRVGIGLDANIAHAVVDRLLGFDRLPSEGRLAVTPVEWGILTYVVAETLRRLVAGPRGPLGVWDLSIDRVGPDPFDAAGLGRIVTLRWPLTLGAVEGSMRTWLPEGLVARWLTFGPEDSSRLTPPTPALLGLASVWRAEVEPIALPRGLRTLRAHGVLPLSGNRLSGTAASPSGTVTLAIDLSDRPGRFVIPAELVPYSAAGRVSVTGPPRFVPTPREAIPVSSTNSGSEPSPAAALDVPVTLVVELGRVNLPLSRLADLKTGDVVELARHSRAPVELTSGGRLVARGELVLIDTELGVRVTEVFL